MGISGSGIAVERGVRVELAAPSFDLPVEEAVRSAEVGKAHRDVVDCTDGGRAVGHRQTELESLRLVMLQQEGQLDRGVDPVDRLHQVEGRAEHVDVGAGGDQPGVRHIGRCQRGEDASFSTHRLVAVVPLVNGRAPEYELLAATPESNQDVLGPTGEYLDVGDRSGSDGLIVHPVDEPTGIDTLDSRAAHAAENAAPPSILMTEPVV